MKKKAIVRCLTALLLSSCINDLSYAETFVIQDDFFVANERRHQWINEQNGRAGELIVSGELFSSPCILESNEMELPYKKTKFLERYHLNLDLVGCGEGRDVTSISFVENNFNVVVHKAVLKGLDDEVLESAQRMVGAGKIALRDGDNKIKYYLSKKQQEALMKQKRETCDSCQPTGTYSANALLSLRLDYE